MNYCQNCGGLIELNDNRQPPPITHQSPRDCIATLRAMIIQLRETVQHLNSDIVALANRRAPSGSRHVDESTRVTVRSLLAQAIFELDS